MNQRQELLRDLARFEKPSQPLMVELKKLGWDWEGPPLLILRRDDFKRILERFLANEVSAGQLQEWAENFEGREDVAFEEAHLELLDDLLFRLATPEINEPITTKVVLDMLEALRYVG